MIALALAISAVLATAPPEGRRWAISIGDNVGLSGEEPLRFAERDAQRVVDVLREVAGVGSDTSATVLGGDAGAVRDALARFGARLSAEATAADWLIVYASSHGGDGSLHLKGTELPIAELLAFVRSARVGVAMLVLDSCRSGAATRPKGLRPAGGGGPARVQAADVEGRIVITSSAADELAQESDELEGSVFTHHFVTGLRGAADASRDGRVSLDEAYAYAYSRTLEATLGSPAGLQRPSFHTELRGHGELVLAEPARAGGRLTLAVEAPGLWLISSTSSGAVVAEVDKPEGPMALALPAGSYRLRLRGDGETLERTVVVPSHGGVSVQGEELERASAMRIAAKGVRRAGYRVAALGTGATGIVHGISSTWGVQLELLRELKLVGPLDLLCATAAARLGRSAGAVAFSQLETELSVGAGPRWRWGPLELAATLQPGVVVVSQWGLPDGGRRLGVEPFADLAATARYRLFRSFAVAVRAQAGFAAVRTDSGLFAVPRASAGAGVGLEW